MEWHCEQSAAGNLYRAAATMAGRSYVIMRTDDNAAMFPYALAINGRRIATDDGTDAGFHRLVDLANRIAAAL